MRLRIAANSINFPSLGLESPYTAWGPVEKVSQSAPFRCCRSVLQLYSYQGNQGELASYTLGAAGN